MIKLDKHTMPCCEDCEKYTPCCFKLSNKTTMVECQHADICINAIHQYQKTCEKEE